MIKIAYQSFFYEFFNGFRHAFFVSSPEHILRHIERWILATAVREQTTSL